MDALSKMFAKALHIEKPWEIVKVEFHEQGKRLDIHIDFPKGSVFACPVCGKEATGLRHAPEEVASHELFKHECHLVSRVSHNQMPYMQVTIPWARKGADFTLLFESIAMALCREMPINTVARLLRSDDNKLWRMVHHYVNEAMKKTSCEGLKTLGEYLAGRRLVFV